MKTFLGFTIVLIYIFSANNALSCTLAGKSLSKFDPAEYVFIGEIIGYTEPVGFDSKRANGSLVPISSTQITTTQTASPAAVGIIVKVNESVYLPKVSNQFEIFPYDLYADCSIAGSQRKDLEKKFPLGSEVRVIAKESIFLTDPTKNIRLEDRPDENGSIAFNTEKESRMTSSSLVFDYKSFKFDYDKDSESKYLLPSFEIRKDLLRLSKAADQKERNRILDRLFYAPVSADVDFHELFKCHTSTETEFKIYFEGHFEMTDPEIFKQYKAYQGALAELIKLGYQRDTSEKALGKAIEHGTDLTSDALLKKSIEILKKDKK